MSTQGWLLAVTRNLSSEARVRYINLSEAYAIKTLCGSVRPSRSTSKDLLKDPGTPGVAYDRHKSQIKVEGRFGEIDPFDPLHR